MSGSTCAYTSIVIDTFECPSRSLTTWTGWPAWSSSVAQVCRLSRYHPHTCATLLLQAGQPVHVVSERLGHKKVEITLNIYAQVLPDMQQGAAATMGALLHG